MIVIARRQLRGSYGLVATGDRFDAAQDVAQDLLRRGLVEMPPATAPAESRDTKVVSPSEVKPNRVRRMKEAR